MKYRKVDGHFAVFLRISDMKIVICDDSIEYLLKLEKLLLKYKETYSDIDFEIEKYSDPVRLYHKIENGELADIYILDMIMSSKSGIDIGNRIRRMDDDCMIIYVTSSEDFALAAYGVHAIRYLLKPVCEDNFFEAVNYAMSYADVKKEAVYVVKTKDGLVPVPYSKIEYIENASRMLCVYLSDGKRIQSIFIRKSFDEEIAEILEHDSFLRVHKSFIVNLRYVEKIVKNSMVMESGKTVPISKNRVTDAKKEYLLFYSKKYR